MIRPILKPLLFLPVLLILVILLTLGTMGMALVAFLEELKAGNAWDRKALAMWIKAYF